MILALMFMGGPGDRGVDVFLPTGAPDRHSAGSIVLTDIGGFGAPRKPRPSVPGHLHTAIDIRRPRRNYDDEPVYPMAAGLVICKRTDGPYAHLIVEHDIAGEKIWTVYEHIAGICVGDSALVDPMVPIARFMNRDELRRYGWQFDHLHFEILKARPFPLKPDATHPGNRCSSYTLLCYTQADLERYFYDPLRFLTAHWSHR